MAIKKEIGAYSAYAIAKKHGFGGTEEEWLASLVGPKGDTGPRGPQGVQGEKGDTGDTGPQGVQGVQGASITNVQIDSNEHIIVTIHDPATNTDTTIDAGPIDNTSAVQSIQQAAQAAITQVTQAQTAGVNAVNSARDTALQQVAASTEAAQTAATQAAESASSANQDAQEAAESATQAAASQTAASESATQAQQAASDAQSAAGEIDAGLIVESASGEVVSVADSAAAKLRGLRIYGKSVQDGVPTPEAPVEIESVGDGGNVTTYVFGQNLIDPMDAGKWRISNNATFEILGNGKIKITGSRGYSGVTYNIPSDAINLLKGKKCVISRTIDSRTNESAVIIVQLTVKTASGLKYYDAIGSPITIDADTTSATFNVLVNNTSTTLETPNAVVFSNLGIYLGDAAQSWDTYEPIQTLTYPTPNGLRAIPVDSDGEYTDEDGQEWIGDYADLTAKKLVTKIARVDAASFLKNNVMPGTEGSRFSFTPPETIINKSKALCNYLAYRGVDSYGAEGNYVATDETKVNIRLTDDITLEEFQQKYPDLYVLCQLETPVESDIVGVPDFYGYNPNTTITTDSDPAAGIEVNYVADTKTYIDNKLAAISEAILGGTTNGNV